MEDMNDRARAIELLREARAILAQRLTEEVLAQGEEILADARGESYMNEIESLHEQLGHKLAHVGQMLSNLPGEEFAPQTTTAAAQHSAEHSFQMATESPAAAEAFEAPSMRALVGPLYVHAPGLPAPRTADVAAGEGSPDHATAAALQAFAAQLQAGDLLAAGRTLGALFDLDEPRAIACAATFVQRVRHEADFYREVMELRTEVQNVNPQRALAILLDCFGLSRGEAAEVLRTIQRRRARNP
jgi:hypothetical protein